MTQQWDVFNDRNHAKLLEIFQETEVPEFVKEAAVAEEQNFSGVPLDAFGDPSTRTYPLNSRSNTWLSREYFKKDQHKFSKEAADAISKRIEKAAAFWKLDDAVAIEPTVEEPPAYIVDVKQDGRTVMNFPIKSSMQCKEAVEHLRNNPSKMTYEMRLTFARGIYNAPDDLKANLDSIDQLFIEKTAGFGVALPEHINHAIATRLACVGRTYPFYAETLAKLAHDIKDADITPVLLQKVASMLDLVDRATEMHRAYGQSLRTPEDELFQLTQKAAEYVKKEIIELTNGKKLYREQLIENKAAVDEFFENVIGEKPYSSEEEMIDIIKSLPADDADSLIEALG